MSVLETPLAHSVRAWLANDYGLYREVERIAAKDNRHDVRVKEVRRLATEVLYGVNGMSSLRHLYRKAYGENRVPNWEALDKFRSTFRRADFEAINWDMLTRDLMEGM